MRRLRVRPRQPSLRGPRETPPGPTTWVRPATGWWERMNAGESPRNQGRSVCRPPLSVSRRRSRGLRKMPRRGADRRAGPRYGPAVPSAEGTGPTARRPRCGDPHSACRRFAPSVLGDIPPTAAGRLLSRNDGAWLPHDEHQTSSPFSAGRRAPASRNLPSRARRRPPRTACRRASWHRRRSTKRCGTAAAWSDRRSRDRTVRPESDRR